MSNVIKLQTPVRRVTHRHAAEKINSFPLLETIVLETVEQPNSLQEEDGNQLAHMSDLRHAHKVRPDDMTTMLEEARKEGFEIGYSKALEEAQAILAQQLDHEYKRLIEPHAAQFMEMIASLRNEWKRVNTVAEDTVIALALSMTEQIIKKEVKTDDNIILNHVREGLKHITSVEHVKLRINPEDEKLVRQYRPELLAGADSVRDIVIEADEQISQGGCIIESDSGNVDATIESQIKRIAGLLTEDRPFSR